MLPSDFAFISDGGQLLSPSDPKIVGVALRCLLLLKGWFNNLKLLTNVRLMSEPQSVKLVAALDGDGGSQVPEQQDVRSSDVSRRQGSRSVLFLLGIFWMFKG